MTEDNPSQATLAERSGGLALNGKSNVEKGVPPVPEQTVESVREDVQVAKQRAKEGRA